MRQKTLFRILIVLFVLALCEFVVRGPVRYIERGLPHDMTGLFAGTLAWVDGNDPYDEAVLLPYVEKAGGNLESYVVYPPSSFVVISPLTLIGWAGMRIVWLGLSLVFVGAAILCMLRLSGLTWREPRGLVLMTLLLAYAPFHTGIAVGQPSVPAVGIAMIALLMASRGRVWLTALLLALSTALKPQIGGVFLLYYLCAGRWRVTLMTIGLLAVIMLIGVGRFELAGIDWLGGFIDANTRFLGDESNLARGAKRFDMINLHILLYQFTTNTGFVTWSVRLFALLGGGLYLLLFFRGNARTKELLCISVPTVLSLLAVYHRAYDAMLLMIPLAWVIMSLRRDHWKIPCIVLLAGCVFLVPGGSALGLLVNRGTMPAAISGQWWLNTIILPHQVWALLVMLGALLVSLWQAGSSDPVEESE